MEQFTILPIQVPFVAISLLLIGSKSTTSAKCIPNNGYALINESLYGTISSLLKQNLSVSGIIYLPQLTTIFFLSFISNFIGLIPYSTTASTEIIITLTLSFLTLIGIFIFGITQHGFIKIVYLYLPSGTPIFLVPLMIPLEILSYCTRTQSLGLRLAVNIITGHVLVKIVLTLAFAGGTSSSSSFILKIFPILFLILFLSLEILIAYLQAYIFLFITIITLRDFLSS